MMTTFKLILKNKDGETWREEVEAVSAKEAELIGNELRYGYVVISVRRLNK